MTTTPSLDGRRFRDVTPDQQGDVGDDTYFEYREDPDGVVHANYEGGSVRLGYLVGTRRPRRIMCSSSMAPRTYDGQQGDSSSESPRARRNRRSHRVPVRATHIDLSISWLPASRQPARTARSERGLGEHLAYCTSPLPGAK